jgi:hypothetical protein
VAEARLAVLGEGDGGGGDSTGVWGPGCVVGCGWVVAVCSVSPAAALVPQI